MMFLKELDLTKLNFALKNTNLSLLKTIHSSIPTRNIQSEKQKFTKHLKIELAKSSNSIQCQKLRWFIKCSNY